jgi:hypothetical protein
MKRLSKEQQDENLKLITDCLVKQLEDAGKDIRDLIPDTVKLLDSIKNNETLNEKK